MVGWTVVFLAQAEDDLAAFRFHSADVPGRLREEILATFHDPFKAKRVVDAVEGHGRTAQIDRLESTAFPKSYRLQILQDYRATVCIIPPVSLVVVVHVFSKSADPSYRRASTTHDARLTEYFPWFGEFVDRARGRRR